MEAAGAVWLAIAVVTLPGLIVSWMAGAKLPAAAAASLPASFGIIGLSAWLWGAIHIPFTWASFIFFELLMIACAAGWRYMFARRHKRISKETWLRSLWPGDWRRGSIVDPAWVLPGAGFITGSWLMISRMLEFQATVPGQMKNIVQGWDMQWHANAVRFIMDEHIASSTRMGELQSPETHSDLFYPSAFHAAAALVGNAGDLHPIEAVNLASIVFPGLAIPAGVAGLAWAIARGRGMVAQIAAGIAPIAIFASPVAAWVGDFVGMRPYVAAMGLSALVIALFMQVPRYRILALPTLLAFLGVMEVHPSAVPFVVAAVIIYYAVYLAWFPDRTRPTDLIWLAIPSVGAMLAFLPQLFAGQTQAEEVQDWNAREDVTASEAWLKAFTMDTRHVEQFFPGNDPSALFWLAGFGAVAMLVWKRQAWAPLLYFLVVATTANALRPLDSVWEPLLTFFGSAHYNSAHRIVIMVALVLYAGAAVGVAVVARVFGLAPVAKRNKNKAWLWGTTAASTALAVLGAWGTFAWATNAADEGAKEAFQSSRMDDRMVDDDQLAAYKWLASRPEAHEGLVMGSSTDGYSWMYALHGLPTAARHYLWPSGGLGTNYSLLEKQAGLLGAGTPGNPGEKNEVDKAAERLGVRFIVSSGNTFWPGPSNWQVHKALWSAPGVTPVYQKNRVTIFAVNTQFTDGELKELQKDAVKNGGSSKLPKLEPTAEPVAPWPLDPYAVVL